MSAGENTGDTVLLVTESVCLTAGSTPIGGDCVVYSAETARGESSTALNDDVIMIRDRFAQTGPGDVRAGDTQIGYYISDYTHQEWYETDRDGDASETPVNNSEGVYDIVVDDPDTETLYIYFHYSRADESYAIGGFYAGGNIDEVASRLTIVGSSGVFLNPGDPIVKDDPGSPDGYGTNSNGDSYAEHRIAGGNGDGFMYQFPAGEYEFDFLYEAHPSFPNYDPVQEIQFTGPNGKDERTANQYGLTVPLKIAVPAQ